MGGRDQIKIIKDIIFNFFQSKKYDLFYVVENSNWSIKSDGQYLTRNINRLKKLSAKTTVTPWGVRKSLIHFGSLNTYLTKNGPVKTHPLNKIIVTCFHIIPGDRRLKYLVESQDRVSFFHTSCQKTKNELIDLGIKEEKIIIIPIGVDLSLFRPENNNKVREELRIPAEYKVIGSFQKDGVGWDDGLKPKLEKGPDLFVKIIKELAKNNKIFVLLVGPARGYVKQNLEKINIPYLDIGYLNNYEDVAKYYRALDFYLISSRIEGGPKAILEAWASGIPVLATKVGMVPDIAEDEKNVILIDPDNNFSNKIEACFKNEEKIKNMIRQGLIEVRKYNWPEIAEIYYQKIYSK